MSLFLLCRTFEAERTQHFLFLLRWLWGSCSQLCRIVVSLRQACVTCFKRRFDIIWLSVPRAEDNR